jgi:hypothetical protein
MMLRYDHQILPTDQNVMLQFVAFAAVAALHALPADAQVFRCADERTGRIAYSDAPCQGSTSGGAVRIQENTLDTSDSREQALRRELHELRQRMDSYETNSDRPAYGRTESDLQAERADSRECQQAKRSLEIESGSMTRSKSSVEAKAAAMRSACGIREPDRVEINNNYGRPPARHRPQPSVITNCDSGGCWDNVGNRYNRGAGNTYFPGGGGGACQMIGSQMHCP